jgi:hypothetical protein
MTFIQNPPLRKILESIRQYREKRIDVDGLQQNVAAIMTALEGDVPQEVRDAIYKAESSIERIRFMVDFDEEASALEKVFNEIEGVNSKYSRQ